MAERAGHNPFGQPFPTGQADTADAWESTAATLERWNNTIACVAGWGPSSDTVIRPPLYNVVIGPTLPATHGDLVDHVATNLFGRPVSAAHKASVLAFLGVAATKPVTSGSGAVTWSLSSFVAVLLDSPYQSLR
jgi:phage tail protein X